MGKFLEAEKLIQLALEVQKGFYGEESLPYAITLNNQALLFQSIGQMEKAEKLLKQCIEIGEEVDEKSDKLFGFKVNLALTQQGLKEYEKAEATYLELLDSRNKKLKLGKTESDAYLYNHLASLYMEMGKTEEAGKYLEEAVDIYAKKLGENNPTYASALRNQVQYFRYQGELDKAWELSKKVVDIRKDALGTQHPEYLDAREDQVLILWDKGDADKASVGFQKLTEQRLEMTEKLFLSMNEHEKGKYWAKIHPKLLLFYNFAVENQEKHPHLLTEMFTLQLKTKGILLNSTQRVKNQILNGENENLKKKYIEWLDEKEQLSLYYTLSKEELQEEGINLDSLEQASQNSEKELIKMSSEFAKAYEFPTTDFHKIKSILKAK